MLLVDSVTSWRATSAGVSVGFLDSRTAAAPVTCGVAIEVPEIVFVPPPSQSEVTLTPGAKRSTQEPKLEKDARRSVVSVAPTVRAAGTRAGEVVQASALLLPAATAIVTLSAMTRWTAASTLLLTPPPRLMLATAGPLVWWATTQSRPAMMPDHVPEPSQPSTRTGTTVADFATPSGLPPARPAPRGPRP